MLRCLHQGPKFIDGNVIAGDNHKKSIFIRLAASNMTTKKLFISWVILAGLALIAGLVSENTIKRAAEIAETQVPPYVPLPNAEAAIEFSYVDCKESLERMIALAQVSLTCERAHANPSESIVQEAHEIHKAKHYRKEVLPRIWKIESNSENRTRVVFMVLVAFAGLAFVFWFKSTALPRLGKVKTDIAEHLDLAQDLKNVGANRKVRKAENDFATLKNLHDNDLISDEMFEKRKAELKEALSENRMFVTK